MPKRTISGELSKGSFRTGIGYAIFFLLVALPTVDAWQYGSDRLQPTQETFRSDFGPRTMRGWPSFGSRANEQQLVAEHGSCYVVL